MRGRGEGTFKTRNVFLVCVISGVCHGDVRNEEASSPNMHFRITVVLGKKMRYIQQDEKLTT